MIINFKLDEGRTHMTEIQFKNSRIIYPRLFSAKSNASNGEEHNYR